MRDLLAYRVVVEEIIKKREAKAHVEVKGQERVIVRKDIEKVESKVYRSTDIEEAIPLDLNLAGSQGII